MFDIQIIGIKFTGTNKFGDFNWMCMLEEYSDSLFIFNDNEEFHNTSRKGAGNAIMRKYNKYSNLQIPKSAGIPTGTLKDGGYTKLNSHSKNQIDNSIKEIIELIKKFKYKRIYYSSELNGKLGTSIFHVDDQVIGYITNELFKLSNKPVQIVKMLSNNFFDDDYQINNNELDDFEKKEDDMELKSVNSE